MMKTKTIRPLVTAVALFAFALPAITAQAAEKMITSNGIEVSTPNIDALDCAQMALVLRGLDESGYRGFDTPEEGHPDYRIFIYENQLSQQQYFNCNAGGGLGDSGAAFSTGFEN